jgi:hypothetical protein
MEGLHPWVDGSKCMAGAQRRRENELCSRSCRCAGKHPGDRALDHEELVEIVLRERGRASRSLIEDGQIVDEQHPCAGGLGACAHEPQVVAAGGHRHDLSIGGQAIDLRRVDARSGGLLGRIGEVRRRCAGRRHRQDADLLWRIDDVRRCCTRHRQIDQLRAEPLRQLVCVILLGPPDGRLRERLDAGSGSERTARPATSSSTDSMNPPSMGC